MTVSQLNDKHLLLKCPLAGGAFKLMESFPAFKKWQGRQLKIRINRANLQHLCNNWPDAEWVGGANDVKVRYLDSLGASQAALEAKDNGAILHDEGHAFKRKPMAHQLKAFCISKDLPAYGLFMEQGTGKTKVILDNASYLYNERKIDTLIVVAWPNGVHQNWVDYECASDLSVPYKAAYWSPAKTKKKADEISEVLHYKDGLRVMTYNVEAFVSERAKESIMSFLRSGTCMVCIDQSASIKNPSAKRTKFLIDEVSGMCSYRRILDGDPVAEGADELYSQFKFLDPWIIGHDTWTGFKAEFCIEEYWGKGSSVVGYKNFDELKRRIDPYSFRVLAKDCLDLPERVYKKWPFDLSPKEKRIFNDLRSKDIALFDDDMTIEEAEELPDCQIIEETLALVKNMRLQQVASGWWPERENFKSIDKAPSRLAALLLLLEQNKGEKAIIFSRFRPDLDMLQKVLGDKAVSYHGGINESGRSEAKRRFMQDEETLYFIGQPRNAGIGHTLTAAKHVIFYTNDPSLRLRAESEKRAHRKGLSHKLMIWDLVARGTTDAKILWALRNKRDASNEIMKDPHQFFLCHDD